MMLRPVALALFLILPGSLTPGVGWAEIPGGSTARVAEPVGQLWIALQMTETLGVMRLEGLDYGTALEDELLGGDAGEAWTRAVEEIYDISSLAAAFEGALAQELERSPGMIAPALAFFGSEQGQRIVTLEVEARRALLDEAVEEAAKVAAEKLVADRSPLVADLRRFIAVGDLEERNVAGALTSNLAFYEGIASEGGMGAEMNRDDLLALVWSQEPEIRAETDAWLMSYLSLAYAPLPPGDLEAYIAFWESPAGQTLNAALFAAFDKVFPAISRDLGRAAALHLGGDDI
jgi:hypothetical protein